MIARLSGTVVAVGMSWAVLEANGVGFRLSCPPATVAGLRNGEAATVETSLVVREDSLTLFGFATQLERDTFELVQAASGIGPKTALAVVSVLTPADLAAAIRAENLRALTAVPGIGTKGAQRLVIELKDKINQLSVAAASQDAQQETTTELWREQVSSGLVGLGWPVKDAEAACEAIAPVAKQQPQPSVGALMKAALQTLART